LFQRCKSAFSASGKIKQGMLYSMYTQRGKKKIEHCSVGVFLVFQASPNSKRNLKSVE
jgi:hypothetical protein